MGEYAQALGHGSRLPDAPCSSEHASTHAHSALSRHSMHVTCPAELIGRIRVGVRVGVDRALVAFHNAACEGARRPNYIVEGKRCCHCTSSNTKLGFLLPMQAIVGARARLRRLVVCCHCNCAFAYMSQPYSSFFAAGAGLDVHAPFFFFSSPFFPSFFLFFLSL